jgi:hypothetical protein
MNKINKIFNDPTFWLYVSAMEAGFAFGSILKDEYGYALIYIAFFLLYMRIRQKLLIKQKDTK